LVEEGEGVPGLVAGDLEIMAGFEGNRGEEGVVGEEEEESATEWFLGASSEWAPAGTWLKGTEKDAIGTSLSGWMCSNAAVRFLYLRSLHGVSTSFTPFSLKRWLINSLSQSSPLLSHSYRSTRYRLRTPTTSKSIIFVTGGFFSEVEASFGTSCLSPLPPNPPAGSAFASRKGGDVVEDV
jgi:hypothetical protein